jgi:hypothetical protein
VSGSNREWGAGNMRQMLGFALVFGALGTGAQAADAEKLRICQGREDMQNVPLVWRPTEEITPANVVPLPPGSTEGAAPRIELRALIDSLPDPKRIGERKQENFNKCVWAVTTKDDVAAWATDRLRFVLKGLGVNIVDHGGDFVLSGELRKFFVEESSDYEGNVGVRLDVASADGKVIWSGLVRGDNGRFGRTFKLGNYYETLSDALIDAARHLAADPGFVAAVSAHAAN